MDLNQRKRRILQYIYNKMSQPYFDRREQSLGFDTYEDFIKFKRNMVMNFNERSMDTLEFLINQIIPISSLMDKESMAEFKTSRLAFNSDGRLVFFNER